ncbi:metallophosphoesterase family protein [Candidatus Bipolaricaulota bacterium]
MTRKLAVLSDIHGNVRALDAVLTDIESRGIRDIVNLGDCVYGPFDPVPVMDRFLRLDVPTVSGNEDRILVEVAAGVAHSRTAAYCANRLNREHINWLTHLPLAMHVHTAFLFHGMPTDDSRYLLTGVNERGIYPRDPDEVEGVLAEYRNPLILCGHDHTPRVVTLESGDRVINPGSVGCPAYADDNPYDHVIENGAPYARYAVVEVGNETVTAELISVAYDWEAAAEEARANGFPDWAQWIATGRAT